MQRKAIAVLFILVSLLTASCSKMDQLFNNGESITERRDLSESFSSISMFNNVNVKLVKDSIPHLELRCPENLIEKITTEVKGDTLVIKNENDHNWLRSYDYDISLTVYYDSLYSINYASIGELVSEDSLRGLCETVVDSSENGITTYLTRSFHLNINEGCGRIDLPFKVDVVKCVFGNGTSEVTLWGRAAYTELIMRSYGVIHAEELNSNFVRVQSNSTNDAYVWARTKLTVWLHSIGNVYYRGNPWIVKECTSDGQVLPLQGY